MRLPVKLAMLLPLLLWHAAAACAAPALQSIKSLAAHYGFPTPYVGSTTVTLRSPYTTVIFYQKSRKMLFNGSLVWLNGAVVEDSGDWTITVHDAQYVIEPLLRSEVTLKNANVAVVVLDAGHGGSDTGAIGRYRHVYEKKSTLDIVKRARAKLQAAGIVVKLTRDHDQTLSLAERTKRAKNWGADLFVSVHFNSSSSAIPSGIETFVLSAAGFPSTADSKPVATRYRANQFDSENAILGYNIQRSLRARAGGADRGVKHARFAVLRSAPCPAALVECGFLSHRGEEANVLSRAHRDNIAQGIADGILAYIGKCGK